MVKETIMQIVGFVMLQLIFIEHKASCLLSFMGNISLYYLPSRHSCCNNYHIHYTKAHDALKFTMSPRKCSEKFLPN